VSMAGGGVKWTDFGHVPGGSISSSRQLISGQLISVLFASDCIAFCFGSEDRHRGLRSYLLTVNVSINVSIRKNGIPPTQHSDRRANPKDIDRSDENSQDVEFE